MIDLESLVGIVVPHIYITRELRALGLTDLNRPGFAGGPNS